MECEVFRTLLKHVSDHLSVLFQFTYCTFNTIVKSKSLKVLFIRYMASFGGKEGVILGHNITKIRRGGEREGHSLIFTWRVWSKKKLGLGILGISFNIHLYPLCFLWILLIAFLVALYNLSNFPSNHPTDIYLFQFN